MKQHGTRQKLGVSLFPFLAVLICTMGALIVLLVLLVQQARLDASTLASRRMAESASDDEARRLREEFEDAQWRRESLEKSRREKTQELADERARLAHLEDHALRLKGQAQELLTRANAIDQGKQLAGEQLAAARADVQRLQEEIRRKQAELDEARRRQAEKEQWYALIPYDGPQGTRRRPIYIECTQHGIILQPEGIIFGTDDFNGPLGPGNPLDAALRTVREHIQKTAGGQAGDAYPLLVVRPGGVVAYNYAREALKAWDDEFGYELISEDILLDFGERDPALAAALARSISVARQRQAAMMAMMPRQFQGEQPLTSFAPDSITELSAPRGAGSRDASAGGPGSGTVGLVEQRGPASSRPLSAAAGSRESAGNQMQTASAAAPPPSHAQPAAVQPADAPATSGSPRSPASDPAPAESSTGQEGGKDRGKLQFGTPRPGTFTSKHGANRDTNWALPDSRGRTTAVTRPIHIAVLADRIVILPERGDDRPPQHLPISTELTPDEVQQFVAAIQREIKGWGLAVSNGYWKPVLKAEIAPTAQQQFDRLQTALEGSGLTLERKSP
jgi:hypothetical protein